MQHYRHTFCKITGRVQSANENTPLLFATVGNSNGYFVEINQLRHRARFLYVCRSFRYSICESSIEVNYANNMADAIVLQPNEFVSKRVKAKLVITLGACACFAYFIGEPELAQSISDNIQGSVIVILHKVIDVAILIYRGASYFSR